MPYKQKLKTPALNPKKKPAYKVTNWTEYNKSLKKRGALSLYFPYGNLEAQFFNSECYIKGVSGQQATYKQAYIEVIYTFYRLFGWGIRQMTGYFEDLWQTKNLDMNPRNQDSLTNKVLITVFSMIAELERDFISERTKEGLNARKAKGIKLGKPKGTLQTSMYDVDKEKIFHLYNLGVPLKKIIKTHLNYGKYYSLKEYVDKRQSLQDKL